MPNDICTMHWACLYRHRVPTGAICPGKLTYTIVKCVILGIHTPRNGDLEEPPITVGNAHESQPR